MKHKIFDNLFVLELANNHWGSVTRGKKIIKKFSEVVRNNRIKAAIKLQMRDVDTIIHSEFKKDESRYIKKTIQTRLTPGEFFELFTYIKNHNCITMATPFDEISVDLCTKMNIDILKIASQDINDWLLLNKIVATKKPCIVSTGGANEKQIDDVVRLFEHRDIPLAINHCVSKYPTDDFELELNQIDYLRDRYPNHVIGLSTHEYHDWETSMIISYAKGARTWERHIDLPYGKDDFQEKISPYCSAPKQIEMWFKAYNKVVLMCGNTSSNRRIIDEEEAEYLFSCYRGLYLSKDLLKGTVITKDYVYSAVPYQKNIGQITSREFVNADFILKRDIKAHEPLTKDDIE
jgi:sialic acid synthase SpsE